MSEERRQEPWFACYSSKTSGPLLHRADQTCENCRTPYFRITVPNDKIRDTSDIMFDLQDEIRRNPLSDHVLLRKEKMHEVFRMINRIIGERNTARAECASMESAMVAKNETIDVLSRQLKEKDDVLGELFTIVDRERAKVDADFRGSDDE
jgi:hypothetical protein